MNKGFSLFEVLLVIGLLAIIFTFTAPYSLKFYQGQIIEEARSNIIDTLQRARHNAVLQKNDSNFGVTTNQVPNNYVMFQVSTSTVFATSAEYYENRDSSQDEVFPLINEISFAGLTDVVFSKLTGLPNATGTIILNYVTLSKSILIEDSGTISKIY